VVLFGYHKHSAGFVDGLGEYGQRRVVGDMANTLGEAGEIGLDETIEKADDEDERMGDEDETVAAILLVGRLMLLEAY